MTKNEKLWLRERDKWFSPWCRRCDGRFHCDEYRLDGRCSLVPDTDDAAEFSERVAAKLAEYAGKVAGYEPCCELCPDKTCNITDPKNCSITLLKDARLQVEEEMDAI